MIPHRRILLALAPVALLMLTAAGAPHRLSYQGRVFGSDGMPLAGPVGIEIALYDAAVGGTLLYQEVHASVNLRDGFFSIDIGAGVPLAGSLGPATFSEPERYVEVTVEGDTLSPRHGIGSVPYSLLAEAEGGTSLVTDPAPTLGADLVMNGHRLIFDRMAGETASSRGDPYATIDLEIGPPQKCEAGANAGLYCADDGACPGSTCLRAGEGATEANPTATLAWFDAHVGVAPQWHSIDPVFKTYCWNRGPNCELSAILNEVPDYGAMVESIELNFQSDSTQGYQTFERHLAAIAPWETAGYRPELFRYRYETQAAFWQFKPVPESKGLQIGFVDDPDAIRWKGGDLAAESNHPQRMEVFGGVSDGPGGETYTGYHLCSSFKRDCVDADVMGSDGAGTHCATHMPTGTNFWAFCN